MTQRLSRAELGDRVFDCLAANDPKIDEATELTGLTRAQWHEGLAYVRDILAETHSEPVIYDARTGRYSLALFEPEVEAFIGKRLLTMMIQVNRLRYGSLVPAGLKFQTAKTREFQRVDLMVARLVEDMDRLREELGVPLSPALKRQAAEREKAGLNSA